MSSPTSPTDAADGQAADAIADTRRWVERAVVGLNLCPFAKAVQAKGQVHYAACTSDAEQDLLDALEHEAKTLLAHAPSARDTTLLIATALLVDFLDFHDFTTRAERLLARRGYEGELQLATFHPRFQFAGTDPDDIANATNRAPWPTLHLLRESSIDRAVDAFPDAEDIFGRNMALLEDLGDAGWQALDVGPGSARRHPPASAP